MLRCERSGAQTCDLSSRCQTCAAISLLPFANAQMQSRTCAFRWLGNVHPRRPRHVQSVLWHEDDGEQRLTEEPLEQRAFAITEEDVLLLRAPQGGLYHSQHALDLANLCMTLSIAWQHSEHLLGLKRGLRSGGWLASGLRWGELGGMRTEVLQHAVQHGQNVAKAQNRLAVQQLIDLNSC